ncbi:hypothetical protein [Streptomyces subrutilus]|uniref:hypothetical protein n=1 Tax=Streptomyces subrutilus TaxID=36818 RepID=UPI0033E3A61E
MPAHTWVPAPTPTGLGPTLILAGGIVFVGSLLLTGIGFALYFFVTTLALPGDQEIGRVVWAAFSYAAKVSALLAVPKATAWGVLAAVITAITGWITTKRWEEDLPAVGVRWSWQQLRVDGTGQFYLATAATVAVTTGVMAAASDEPAAWFSDAAVIVLLFAPLVAASALAPRPVAPDHAAGPASLVRLHRRTLRATVLRTGLVTTLATGVVVGISVGAAEEYPLPLLFGVFSALAVGVIVGLTIGLASTSWAPYAATTSLLALRRHTPWHLQDLWPTPTAGGCCGNPVRRTSSATVNCNAIWRGTPDRGTRLRPGCSALQRARQATRLSEQGAVRSCTKAALSRFVDPQRPPAFGSGLAAPFVD